MKKRIACSLIVIVLAVVALTAIWNPDAIASIYANAFDWILTLIVLALAGFFPRLLNRTGFPGGSIS